MKMHGGALLIGLLLGAALSLTGFSDYGQVHEMFTFAGFRLFLTFCGAVALSMVGFLAVARRLRGDGLPPRRIHKATIVGASIFGVGWAITGACPAVTLVQLGQGYLPALASVGGVLAGAGLCGLVRRKITWPADSCDE